MHPWLQRRWSSPLERPMAGNRDRRPSNQKCYTRPSRAKQRSTSFWTMVMVGLCIFAQPRESLGLVAGTAGRCRQPGLRRVLHTLVHAHPADLDGYSNRHVNLFIYTVVVWMLELDVRLNSKTPCLSPAKRARRCRTMARQATGPSHWPRRRKLQRQKVWSSI